MTLPEITAELETVIAAFAKENDLIFTNGPGSEPVPQPVASHSETNYQPRSVFGFSLAKA